MRLSTACYKKPVSDLEMGFFALYHYSTSPVLPFCAHIVHLSSDYLVGVESVVSGELVCILTVEVDDKSRGIVKWKLG